MYESLTYEQILGRMLDRVPNNIDKREGSVIYDALAPAAVEIKLMYIEFDDIMNESFADTASRDYLIRRCAERGIEPDPATHAVLQGEFTPANIDMTGKRFNMPNAPINYVVTSQLSAGVYQVQCETVGSEGNQYLGQIIPIDYVDGLETAQLTDILIPAKDEQDTESLRQEYFESFNSKAFGGNEKDYLNKTNEIDGVGSTKVTPIWNGGGTVKLTILDAQYNRASTVLIDLVQNTIDPTGDGMGLGLAPIGHVVTVDTVNEVTVNIQTTVTLEDGVTWGMVQQQAIDAIQQYFLELRQSWANQASLTVRVSQIETRLLGVTGILDVTNTKLNGSTANLALGTYDIPIFGGIVV
jgi:uncharacterized phage protein gp47/JayE